MLCAGETKIWCEVKGQVHADVLKTTGVSYGSLAQFNLLIGTLSSCSCNTQLMEAIKVL